MKPPYCHSIAVDAAWSVVGLWPATTCPIANLLASITAIMTSNRKFHLPILTTPRIVPLPLFEDFYEPIAHSGGCQSMDIHFLRIFYNFLSSRLELEQNRHV